MRSYTLSTNKAVVVSEFGGFRLSNKAKMFIATVKNMHPSGSSLEEAETIAKENRQDEALLLAVKLLGGIESSEVGSLLKIVEIPYSAEWEIVEGAGGSESIVEKHRVWR